MTLEIAQVSRPKDASHWSWSVWLEGPTSELDNVSEVIWKLHPTFSPSVVRRDTRANKFKLSSSGWGEFMIAAEVKMKIGRKKLLQHWLELADSAPSKAALAGGVISKMADKTARPTVFLSYSLDNANLASHVAKALEDSKYQVARDVDVPAGVSIQDWTKEQIAKSDAVIVLGAEQTSLYQTREAELAQSAGKAVIPVATGKITKEALSLERPVKFVQAGTGSPENVALNLVQKIDKLL